MSQIEQKLKEMGYLLPPQPFPTGSHIPFYQTGNLVYLSGVLPRNADGKMITGKLGSDLTVKEGYEAARLCALNSLSNLKAAIGDLDKVIHFVKVFGMVNSEPEFDSQPAVMNGFSDLLVDIFGDRGRHARSAVGLAALPGSAAVEVEAIVEVET
jgi:enamine deaminase RidA (YjgF/YER057c/UK114 family)